jgi:hypothetical protein
MKRNEFRTYISGRAEFDDARYWQFARRLDGQPLHVDRSWFDRHGDAAVVVTAAIILIAILIGVIA